MEVDELFLNVADELWRAVNQPDGTEYRALSIARLLRQLLLEEDPLLYQANRAVRMRIKFRVNRGVYLDSWPADLPKPLFWAVKAISPLQLPAAGGEQLLNLAQFLKLKCVLAAPHDPFTIREVVLVAAHQYGAVHRGPPKDDRESALAALGHTFKIQGENAVISMLSSVAAPVLEAVHPLHDHLVTVVNARLQGRS